MVNMPYKNSEKQRTYMRDYMKKYREKTGYMRDYRKRKRENAKNLKTEFNKLKKFNILEFRKPYPSELKIMLNEIKNAENRHDLIMTKLDKQKDVALELDEQIRQKEREYMSAEQDMSPESISFLIDIKQLRGKLEKALINVDVLEFLSEYRLDVTVKTSKEEPTRYV